MNGRPTGDDGAVAAISAVLAAALAGDLEPRVGAIDAHPELVRLADQVDAVLDIADAFVREAGTALAAAAEGRYHRRILTRGLPGAYREAADRVNNGQDQMRAAAHELAVRDAAQHEIASTAKDISMHVASAATELGASADTLARSAAAAVRQADEALGTMGRLSAASREIDAATRLITKVAAQTRLLALNATIEAARAGEAGRGFAVVAKEVKTLAEETTQSSAEIEHQVQAAAEAAFAAEEAIGAITATIRQVDTNVAGIADAAGGQGGLSYLAETLHREIGHFDIAVAK